MAMRKPRDENATHRYTVIQVDESEARGGCGQHRLPGNVCVGVEMWRSRPGKRRAGSRCGGQGELLRQARIGVGNLRPELRMSDGDPGFVSPWR